MSITPLTPQQAFDLAVNGIRAQGYALSLQHAHGSFTCRYRGEGGTKCAVGFMIPDDMYYPGLEGDSIDGIFCGWGDADTEKHAAVRTLLGHDTTYSVAADLQELHDASMMPRLETLERAAAFEAGFQRIARDYCLVYKSALDGQPVPVPASA